MKKLPPKTASSLEYSKMLFLVSHGLQTPLSSIRWGCGRLRRTGENLSEQQKLLLEGVQREARLLSHMFDWMLLLAKVEEGVFTPNIQDVYVNDFLITMISEEMLLHDLQVVIVCPEDLQIQVDRTIFTSLMQALLLTVSLTSTSLTPKLTITTEDDDCVMILEAPLALSLLQEGEGAEEKRRVVGGVPGCLLSVSSSFARALQGSLESVEENDVVTRLVLRLPLHPSLTSLLQ